MQRRKGKTGELEVVNLLKVAGIESKRISPLETNHVDYGDVTVNGDIGSVKFGQHVPKFIYTALGEAKYLFSRRNKSPWLVTMKLKDFIYLVSKKL